VSIANLWHIVAAIYLADLSRYVLAAGAAFLLLWKVLRHRLERRRINPAYPPPAQLRHEFAYSMSTVAIFAATGFMIYSLAAAGALTVYTRIPDYGWGYWIASLFGLIAAHDTYFYWTHRALHHPAVFRKVHAVHHRSRNPSPWAAYAFHPIEAIIQSVFLPLALIIAPLHPSVIFLFTSHMALRNVIGHSGIELYPRNAVRNPLWSWLTSTTHHHLHHERVRGNYGLYFSWWDRYMGTQNPSYLDVFDQVTLKQPRRTTP
jgi:sterol desaturase/sphingolipid hydroxylase (fatty acid hydroxylase superfamily)